jgi:hypothetical protein
MKKGVLIVLLVSILFFTSGCVGDLFASEGEISAGRGVMIEFTSVPDSLYPEYGFVVEGKVTNFVQSEVSGVVCITDSIGNIHGGIQDIECQPIYLPSAYHLSDEALEPEEEVFAFGPYSYRTVDEDFSSTTNVAIKFNYEVETTASTIVCIPSPLAETSGLPCKISETLRGVKQPEMPLEVVEIEKEILPAGEGAVKVVLRIYVKKEEDGNLISLDELNSAVPRKDDAVDFAIWLDKQAMTCKNLNKGKLTFGSKEERVVLCTQDVAMVPGQDFLESHVQIKMHYGFQKTINQNIELKKEVI